MEKKSRVKLEKKVAKSNNKKLSIDNQDKQKTAVKKIAKKVTAANKMIKKATAVKKTAEKATEVKKTTKKVTAVKKTPKKATEVKKRLKALNKKVTVIPALETQECAFEKGQKVLWQDNKTTLTKKAIVIEVKKRIKIQFEDKSFSWVGKNNLTLLEEENLVSQVSDHQIENRNDQEDALKKKLENLTLLVLDLQEKVRESIEERDKARAYRIDMENERNQMRTEINLLRDQLEEKKDVIESKKMEIENFKERLRDQINRASRSELEKKTLLVERDSFKTELSQTKSELDYNTTMKSFNQSEKISLQDKIADSVKQKIYISSDSLTAKKRQEDIAAGFPVSDNIEVVDVNTLQATLIQAAKEKYKDNAYIKVLRDTMRRKEENKKTPEL